MSSTATFRRRVIRASSRFGMTLVELAMVIFALSILFTILFGFFYNVSVIADRQREPTAARRDAVMALQVIRSTINQAYYFKKEKRLVFAGKSHGDGEDRKDTLTFAAVHPGSEYTGMPAVREVSFYVTDVDSDSDAGVLMKREDAPVDKNPGEGGAHYRLLENVRSIVFRYSADGVTWSNEWNSKKKKSIPRLIQIRIVALVNDRPEVYETLSNPGVFQSEKKGVL